MSWTALHHELLYIRQEPGREGTMKSVATVGLGIALMPDGSRDS